jgi:primosomal protein N' (replication factor Y)
LAVDKTSAGFDILFTYKIPPELRGGLRPGQRVIVPFGRGNQERQAMLMELCAEPEEGAKLKSIARVVDPEPVINSEFLQLVLWLREKTFCTYYEAVRLVIPLGLNLKAVAGYSLVGTALNLSVLLSPEETRILEEIQKGKSPGEGALLDSLIERGFVRRSKEFAPNIKGETLLMARLGEIPEKPTPKQRLVIDLLEEFGELSIKEIIYYTGVSRALIDALEKKSAVSFYEREVAIEPEPVEKTEEGLDLNQEQQEAAGGLSKLLHSGKGGTALLYGVTGSGKTRVYTRLIRETLDMGRQVIMLVPEIALTPQTIRLFKNAFGSGVAVLHSGLSAGERLNEYRRIKSGAAKIAVGTRSAVFSPFDNIGLIVIDEEQEASYKSERSPRYQARDVAKFRCAWHKAPLLLVSATPSIESYYFSQSGRYGFFKLKSRPNENELPQVYIIDMNDEKAGGNMSSMSGELMREIDNTLEAGEQAILLLNRRGFNTVVMCSGCKEIINCPNCSLSLTYHKANDKLVCHCCGYMRDKPLECPKCHDRKFRFLGLGTQKAEEELEDYFPDARVLRLDLDTSLRKFSREEKLEAFRKGEFDLMIGTQMVAKGLDFENVTLVGILLADQALCSGDFRGSERAFALMTQAVGRAGRGGREGRACIQTYNPFNKIINLAALQDYEGFYKAEIDARRTLILPPFAAFCVIGFTSLSREKAETASGVFLRELGKALDSGEKVPLRVFGPSPAAVVKTAGKYRYQLVLKCLDDKKTRALIRSAWDLFSACPESRGVLIFVDMNYYGNL